LPATGGRSFKEDITNWESQRAAFQDWADEMLPGIWTIVLAANVTLIVLYQNMIHKDNNGYPTITYTTCGSPILPHVNLKGLSLEATAALQHYWKNS
jgi:hypothetical protein